MEELRKDQETTQAVVSGLTERLEAVAAQMRDLQEQTNKDWEGVQLQLKAIENATQRRRDGDYDKEQLSLRMGDSNFSSTIEVKLTKEDRGNPYSKLEFPDFDGVNMEDWIYCSERYFEFERVEEAKQVRLASVHMYGKALQWHFTFLRNRGRGDMPMWTEYVDALTKRFGKAVGDNPMERSTNLKEEELLRVGMDVREYDEEKHEVVEVLEEFAEIFQEPTTLPLCRQGDHSMVVKDGVQGISRKSLGRDYLQLNQHTLKEKFLILVIEELRDDLQGSPRFSKIDLRLRYHQIRMNPGDVHKTVLRTYGGHYEFLRSNCLAICRRMEDETQTTEETEVTKDTRMAEKEWENIKQRGGNVVLHRIGWRSSKGGRISIRKKFEEGVCSIYCDGGELMLCDHKRRLKMDPLVFYDKTSKLPDARPLINVCDRSDFVPDLTHYLYSNNMLRYIDGYVQKVNPQNTPLVVGQLLDDECSEDFIKGSILSVRSLLPVEPLVDEGEKRNRLRLLTQFVEHLGSEGSQDVHVHNALGKIIIVSNNNLEHFTTTNPYHDSGVVGKYGEKRDPMLAVVAYRRGHCDDELINVTSKNSLFKLQAGYVVERMDGDLWEKVLNPENEYRRQLIDQVVTTALPERKSPEQVSVAVKAFMTADLPHELIEPLEKIVLPNSAFSGNFGDVVVEALLYEEAFAISKKFNMNVQAVNVLLDNIQSIERAVEFAFIVEEDAVWSQVAKAQLREGLVSDAIESFIRAYDATRFLVVNKAAEDVNVYHDLVKSAENGATGNVIVHGSYYCIRVVSMQEDDPTARRNKGNPPINQHLLHSLLIPGEIYSEVSMNLIGDLPKSHGRNVIVIVAAANYQFLQGKTMVLWPRLPMSKAHHRVWQITNKHILDGKFAIDDWVYMKLHSYRQSPAVQRVSSLRRGVNGQYRVSILWPGFGQQEDREPVANLHKKMIDRGSRAATKVLTQRSDPNEGEPTWEFLGDLMQKGSECTLEDKCDFEGRNLMHGKKKLGNGPKN